MYQRAVASSEQKYVVDVSCSVELYACTTETEKSNSNQSSAADAASSSKRSSATDTSANSTQSSLARSKDDSREDRIALRLDMSPADMRNLYDALQNLYDEQIYPLEPTVRARLQQQSFPPHLLSLVPDLYAMFPEYVIERNAETGVASILFRRTPKTFRCWVDPNSAEDPYSEEMWAMFGEYIEKLATDMQNKTHHTEIDLSSFVFHRGRYGMAEELQNRSLDFFKGKSLGELCHIVELAIKQRKLLAYEHSLLLPIQACKSLMKARARIPTLHSCIEDADLRSEYISDCTELKRCVEELFDKYKEGFNLSVLKKKIQVTFGKQLWETTFNHAKLLDLVKASPLNEICVVQELKGKGGYMMRPQTTQQQEVATTTNCTLPLSLAKPSDVAEKRHLPHTTPSINACGVDCKASRAQRATSSASTEAKDYVGSTGLSDESLMSSSCPSPMSAMSPGRAASRFDLPQIPRGRVETSGRIRVAVMFNNSLHETRMKMMMTNMLRKKTQMRVEMGNRSGDYKQGYMANVSHGKPYRARHKHKTSGALSSHTANLLAHRDAWYFEKNSQCTYKCIQLESVAQSRCETAYNRCRMAQSYYSASQNGYSMAQQRWSTARYRTTQGRQGTAQGRHGTAQEQYSTALEGYCAPRDWYSTVQGRHSTAQERCSTAWDRTLQGRQGTAQGRYGTAQEQYSTAQEGRSTARDWYSTVQDLCTNARAHSNLPLHANNRSRARVISCEPATHCSWNWNYQATCMNTSNAPQRSVSLMVHFQQDEPAYLSSMPDNYA